MPNYTNTRDLIGDQAALDGLIDHSLESFTEDGVTYLRSSAFQSNAVIREIILPGLISLSGNPIILDNSNLELLDFGGSPSFSSSWQSSNSKLKAIIIRGNTVASAGSSSMLRGTPIAIGEGGIYVPSNLVSSYKSATNWSAYAANIYPIEDYPRSNFDAVSDTWTQIVAASSDGTYDSKYSVGDTKTVTVGSNSIRMQLVAKDADTLSSGGTAHMTWLCKNFYTTHNMNSSSTTSGGWASSEMRSWLISDILPNLPSEVQNGIKEVDKTYYDFGTTSTLTSQDKIWIPSYREVGFGTNIEDSGPIYSVFSSQQSRIKYNTTSGSASYWWLRSASSDSYFCIVYNNGGIGTHHATNANGVVFGFCI